MLVNPCSYDAVSVVLRNIRVKAGIRLYGTGTKEWIIFICDGIPDNLCHTVTAHFFKCSLCDASIFGLDSTHEHIQQFHLGHNSNIYNKEFDWVILQPGTGHIEMNMVKGITELAWEVFWADLEF